MVVCDRSTEYFIICSVRHSPRLLCTLVNACVRHLHSRNSTTSEHNQASVVRADGTLIGVPTGLVDIAKLQELFVSLVEISGIQVLKRTSNIHKSMAVPATILP